MAQKGRRFENDVARRVTRQTGDACMAWPAGYSGNNAIPSPDIVAVTPRRAAGIELKNWDATPHGIPQSDLTQLLAVQKNYLDVALLINFDHREPLIVEPVAPSLDGFDIDGGPSAVENFKLNVPDAFAPRVTDGPAGEDAALRFSQPSLDDWPSAKNGDGAAAVICDWLGISLDDA